MRFPPPEEHKQVVARALVNACSAEHADGLFEPLLDAAAVSGKDLAQGTPAASHAGFRCYTFGAPEGVAGAETGGGRWR